MNIFGMESIIWLFAYLLIGSTFYLLDMKYGVLLRRHIFFPISEWFIKMSSKKDEYIPKIFNESGFLYKRKLKIKIFYSTLISAFISFMLLIYGSVGIETKIILSVFEVFVFNLGVLLGPLIYNLGKGRKKVLEYIDDIESKLEDGEDVFTPKLEDIKKSFSFFGESQIDKVNSKISDLVTSAKDDEKSKTDVLEENINKINKILGK
jgi:hypothetical protein